MDIYLNLFSNLSFEVGFDGTFFQNRLTIGLTYYKTNTKNQFFSVAAPYESGLRNRYVNAGNVENQGFEFSAGWYQQFNDDFSWSTDLNFSYNDNTIKELVDDLPNGLTLTDFGGAKIILKEGGSYGDLYVRHIMRDDSGKPMKDATTGNPIVSGDTTEDNDLCRQYECEVQCRMVKYLPLQGFHLVFPD